MEHCLHSGVFIFNFGNISHLVLVFLLSTLSKQMSAGFTHFCVCDYQRELFEFERILCNIEKKGNLFVTRS